MDKHPWEVGQDVEVCIRYDRPYVATITRLTKTQVVVGDEKYRRSSGYRVGYDDPWYHSFIKPLTEDARQTIRLRHDRDLLRRTAWQNVGDELVTKIASLVKAETKAREESA
jgi:hypothetical protein